MARRVLVIAPAGTPEAALRETIAEEPAPVELRVVSPASDVSFAQWLANAEDDARAEAEETAQRTAEALAEEASVVGAEPATRPGRRGAGCSPHLPGRRAGGRVARREDGREASWLERAAVPGLERLGLPVRYVRASGSRA